MQPKLDHITINGFRSFAHVEKLPLNGVNVLIGANGSGKSNFIEAFTFLRAIRQKNLQRYVAQAGGASRLLHYGAAHTPEMTLRVSLNDEKDQYEIVLIASDNDGLRPISEKAYYWPDKQKHSTPCEEDLTSGGVEAEIGNEHLRPQVAPVVRGCLDSWVKYQFDDTTRRSPIRLTADVNDNRHLRTDGSNLAAFLYLLRRKHEESLDVIQRTVRLVAPFFGSFILEPDALNENKIRLQWRHRGSDAYLDAAALSDGTLRFIALSTLFLQPAELRPSIILLDEPELGLHPYAIAVLSSIIKSVSAETQVLLATQSSTLLDHFEPNDVVVAERVDGCTGLKRLEADRLESCLRRYSLGQLWEKNELGGRPSAESWDAKQKIRNECHHFDDWLTCLETRGRGRKGAS